MGPTNRTGGGFVMVISADWPNALKLSSSNDKTTLMQFICLVKRLLNITNRVQFPFHFIIVPEQRL
jgi:hypothetical protein